jgi:ABC-type lipoprotein export system ATPase subunit
MSSQHYSKGIPLKIACIVPGSYIQIWNKKGITGPQKADVMFLGRFSNISKKYAKEFYEGNYFYLTPKQGLLAPADIVPAFAITDSASFDNPDAASKKELKDQFKRLHLDDYELIAFLGTKGYIKNGWTKVLEELLGQNKDRLYCPLADCEEENFGLARIKDAIITGVPLFFPDTRSPVRLKKIEVQKLFDQYNYPNIALFSKERLTILVAPNGFGKTTLMEMLYRICALKTAGPETCGKLLAKIQAVPFESIRLEFDNNTALVLRHSTGGKKAHKKNEQVFSLYELAKLEDFTTIRKFINFLPFIPVKFIKSSRLTEYSKYSIRKKTEQDPKTSLLRMYSNEIIQRIESLFSIYAEVTDDYECTSMKRLTEERNKVKSFHIFLHEPYKILSRGEAIAELENLTIQREFFRSTGFLKVNQNLPLGPDPKKITDDPEQLKAITLHIRDSQEKYQLFELLRQKILLLQEIINGLFLDKTFSINYENGFEVIRLGKIIDIEKLSSGEQHQIILYYDLIFNTESGTLVLIDEPEISIHIEWQRQFLRNLQKISKMVKCDFIVTTHSPDIVNDKWNLIVQLNEGMK